MATAGPFTDSRTASSKPGRIRRFARWWFKGRWWAKALKFTALAVIVYNVLAFVLMWCPPVRGVVVDIDSGKPVSGAIVHKSGIGPFVFPMVYPVTGGAFAQARTDQNGCFAFPAAFAHPTPKTHAWFDVLWPLQWLNTIGIRVWQEEYIGVSSLRQGMWWRQEAPPQSAGFCKVERFRIPLFGFYYRVLLRRASAEAEWQVKLDSVNLGKDESAEQSRLFNDLTGYLERWPEGEGSPDSLHLLLHRIAIGCDSGNADRTMLELAGDLSSREALRTIVERNDKILKLASRANASMKPEDRARCEYIAQCTEILEGKMKGGQQP